MFASIEFHALGVGEATFSLILGAISAFFASVLYFLDMKGKPPPAIKKIVGLVLGLTWIIAVGILTFDRPFNVSAPSPHIYAPFHAQTSHSRDRYRDTCAGRRLRR